MDYTTGSFGAPRSGGQFGNYMFGQQEAGNSIPPYSMTQQAAPYSSLFSPSPITSPTLSYQQPQYVMHDYGIKDAAIHNLLGKPRELGVNFTDKNIAAHEYRSIAKSSLGWDAAAIGVGAASMGLGLWAGLGVGYVATEMASAAKEEHFNNYRLTQRVNRMTGGIRSSNGGYGLSGKENVDIAKYMKSEAAKDLLLDQDQYENIVAAGQQGGLFKGVDSAEGFKNKASELTRSIKSIMDAVGSTNVTELINQMTQFSNMGVKSTAGQEMMLKASTLSAKFAGMGQEEMQNQTSAAIANAKATGVDERLATMSMHATAANMGLIQQSGEMSSKYYNNTAFFSGARAADNTVNAWNKTMSGGITKNLKILYADKMAKENGTDVQDELNAFTEKSLSEQSRLFFDAMGKDQSLYDAYIHPNIAAAKAGKVEGINKNSIENREFVAAYRMAAKTVPEGSSASHIISAMNYGKDAAGNMTEGAAAVLLAKGKILYDALKESDGDYNYARKVLDAGEEQRIRQGKIIDLVNAGHRKKEEESFWGETKLLKDDIGNTVSNSMGGFGLAEDVQKKAQEAYDLRYGGQGQGRATTNFTRIALDKGLSSPIVRRRNLRQTITESREAYQNNVVKQKRKENAGEIGDLATEIQRGYFTKDGTRLDDEIAKDIATRELEGNFSGTFFDEDKGKFVEVSKVNRRMITNVSKKFKSPASTSSTFHPGTTLEDEEAVSEFLKGDAMKGFVGEATTSSDGNTFVTLAPGITDHKIPRRNPSGNTNSTRYKIRKEKRQKALKKARGFDITFIKDEDTKDKIRALSVMTGEEGLDSDVATQIAENIDSFDGTYYDYNKDESVNLSNAKVKMIQEASRKYKDPKQLAKALEKGISTGNSFVGDYSEEQRLKAIGIGAMNIPDEQKIKLLTAEGVTNSKDMMLFMKLGKSVHDKSRSTDNDKEAIERSKMRDAWKVVKQINSGKGLDVKTISDSDLEGAFDSGALNEGQLEKVMEEMKDRGKPAQYTSESDKDKKRLGSLEASNKKEISLTDDDKDFLDSAEGKDLLKSYAKLKTFVGKRMSHEEMQDLVHMEEEDRQKVLDDMDNLSAKEKLKIMSYAEDINEKSGSSFGSSREDKLKSVSKQVINDGLALGAKQKKEIGRVLDIEGKDLEEITEVLDNKSLSPREKNQKILELTEGLGKKMSLTSLEDTVMSNGILAPEKGTVSSMADIKEAANGEVNRYLESLVHSVQKIVVNTDG